MACLPLCVVVGAIGSLHAISHGLLGCCLLLRCSTYTVTPALSWHSMGRLWTRPAWQSSL